jgi:hypothetical protein
VNADQHAPRTSIRWCHRTLAALALSLVAGTPLVSQTQGFNRAPRQVTVVEAEFLSSLRRSPATWSEMVQRWRNDPLGTTGGQHGSFSRKLEEDIARATAVYVTSEARDLLDAVHSRVDRALVAVAGTEPRRDTDPTTTQIVGASVIFSSAVARAAGTGGAVTPEKVSEALQGLCPLYPIC